MVSVGKPAHGIKTKLIVPLVVLLLPILIIQAYCHYHRFATRRAEELQANLVLARAVGVAFNELVQDVLRQELAIAVLVMDSPSPLPPVLPLLLRESAQDYPVRSFSWMSPEGRVLISSNPNLQETDISGREYFKELVSGRGWHVSDLVQSKATGEPIFTISRSARDKKGNLLGFVVASLDAQRVEELLAIERPKDAGISLLDRRGMLVATYPAKELTWEQRNWLKLYPQKLEYPLKGRETTIGILASNGKKRLVGAAPVPSIGWVAASSRSEDAVMDSILSSLMTEAILFLVVTLAAFGTALALSRPISASIVGLRDQALALGRGEKDNLPIGPSSTREFNELAQSFSKMAEEVRNREKALSDSESRLRAIFESTEEAIIILDDERRCLEANPAAGVITGVPHKQLVGRFLRDFVDSYADFPFTWESVLRAGRFRGEVRIRHISGSLRIVEASAVAHIGPGRHLFVGHDITDRKQAEAALRESEAKFRLIAESTADVISQHDSDYRILYVSPSVERIFGYSPEELIGYTPDIATPEDAMKAATEAITEALQKGADRYRVEHRIRRKDGAMIWVETNGTLIYDRDAKLKGIQCLVRDVSERKRVEEALKASEGKYRRLCNDLELRVKERTAELERRNKELTEFAFIASHDLSEPLRKIESFGSLLWAKGTDNLSEVQKDYITRMTVAASRMKELLDALLRYSRIGSREQEFKPVRLNDVVKDAAGDLEVAVRKIGASVEIGDLPIVRGDPYQWRQVFQNLIGNAAKYHRSEVKPFIKIYGEETDEVCRIFVEDNGIGFDERYVDKIFLPFQRLHGKNEYPGTGIGLAICQKIIERHGGTIAARSTPGKGSIFILTMPLNKEP